MGFVDTAVASQMEDLDHASLVKATQNFKVKASDLSDEGKYQISSSTQECDGTLVPALPPLPAEEPPPLLRVHLQHCEELGHAVSGRKPQAIG